MRHRSANQVKTRLRLLVRVFTISSGSATAFDGALAQCHGSRLLPLRLLFLRRPAVVFLPSPTFRKVFTDPASTSCPSRPDAHFVPPFGVFPLADPALWERQSHPTVLMHSGNLYPLGNCDSPGIETFSGYLTRFGTVSNRSLPLSSFSRY